MKTRVIVLVVLCLLCTGAIKASLLIDKQNPTIKEYADIKDRHIKAKYKEHVQTLCICEKPNSYATVLLTNGTYFGSIWGVIEKNKIPDLIEYDIREEGEGEAFIHDLGLEFDWIANPKADFVPGEIVPK